jgi:mannose-6-phosphate isomerase
LALEAIDFKATGKNKLRREPELNKAVNLVSCEFFNTSLMQFDKPINREYYFIDSFVVYICIEGEFNIRWDGESEHVTKGETVLLPAMIKEVVLVPAGEAHLLEIFINT